MKIKKGKLRSSLLIGMVPFLAVSGFLTVQSLKMQDVKAAEVNYNCLNMTSGFIDYNWDLDECQVSDIVIGPAPAGTEILSITNFGIEAYKKSGVKLKSITITGDYKIIDKIDIFNTLGNRPDEYMDPSDQVEVNLPDDVRYISDFAFEGFQFKNGNINLPKNLQAIGDRAFEKSNLNTINIPSKVTDIGNNAFAFTDIKNFTLPATVQNVGQAILQGSKFESMTVEGNPSRRLYINVKSDPTFDDAKIVTRGEDIGDDIFIVDQGIGVSGSPLPSQYDSYMDVEWFRYLTMPTQAVAMLYAPNLSEAKQRTGVYSYAYSSYLDNVNEEFMELVEYYSEQVDEGAQGVAATIVNPTSVTIRYVDEDGNEIAPSYISNSKDDADIEPNIDTLARYLGKTYGFELTTPDLAYIRYWAGLDIDITTDKEISGYTLMTTDPQVLTLDKDASKNVVTFVYKKNQDRGDEEAKNIATPVNLIDENSSNALEVPNTGVVESKTSTVVVMAVFAVVFILTLTKMTVVRK